MLKVGYKVGNEDVCSVRRESENTICVYTVNRLTDEQMRNIRDIAYAMAMKGKTLEELLKEGSIFYEETYL